MADVFEDINQDVTGNGSTQIAAGGNVTAAIGDGAMAAQGDIHVHKHGIDPKNMPNSLQKSIF